MAFALYCPPMFLDWFVALIAMNWSDKYCKVCNTVGGWPEKSITPCQCSEIVRSEIKHNVGHKFRIPFSPFYGVNRHLQSILLEVPY